VTNVGSEVDVGRLKTGSAFALGFGGLLPFWTAAVIRWWPDWIGEDLAAIWSVWLVLYAAIIVSFMAGGRWAFSVLAPDTRPASVFGGFLGAIGPALAAWVIAAIPTQLFGRTFDAEPKLILLAGLLVLQWFQDNSHTNRGGMPLWYMELRTVLVLGATTPIFFPPIIRMLGTALGVGG